MTQATQPKVEWGFYAITPRIVRTQYRDLSHAEKWLYVCLKDLCGEKGVCYRTLRSLSEETNISIASLSSMIPNLQKAGLIHAEKKKRSNSGKEIWHISIVDIWQANHEYCSKIEQSGQVVQNLNNDVQNLNEVSQDCSENERVCSDFPYRRIIPEEETITEERTVEERDVAHATARSQSLSHDRSFQEQVVQVFGEYLVLNGINLKVKLPADEETEKREAIKPSQKDVAHVQNQTHSGNPGNSSQPHLDTNEHSRPLDASPTLRQDHNMGTQPPLPRKPQANSTIPRRPRPQQQELTDEIPAGAHSKPVEPHAEMTWGTRKCLQWFDYWRGGVLIAKYKLQQAAGCAKGLAEQFDEATVIEIRNEMAGDQYYIDRGGVDVCDVANNCHKYLNKIRTKQKPPSNEHKATQQPANAFIERCLDKDYNKKKLEWMREENARRRQAQAGGVQ